MEAGARQKSGHSKHQLISNRLSGGRSTADSFLFPSSLIHLDQNASWVALKGTEPPKQNLEA